METRPTAIKTQYAETSPSRPAAPVRTPTRAHSPLGSPRIPSSRFSADTPTLSASTGSSRPVVPTRRYSAETFVEERRSVSTVASIGPARVERLPTRSEAYVVQLGDDASPYAALIAERRVAYSQRGSRLASRADSFGSTLPENVSPKINKPENFDQSHEHAVASLRQQALQLKEEKSRGMGGMRPPPSPLSANPGPDETLIMVSRSRLGSEVDAPQQPVGPTEAELTLKAELDAMRQELQAAYASREVLLSEQQVHEANRVSQIREVTQRAEDAERLAKRLSEEESYRTQQHSHTTSGWYDSNSEPLRHAMAIGIDSPYTLNRRLRQPILAPATEPKSLYLFGEDLETRRAQTDRSNLEDILQAPLDTAEATSSAKGPIISPPTANPEPQAKQSVQTPLSLLLAHNGQGRFSDNLATLSQQFAEGTLDADSYSGRNLPPVLKGNLTPTTIHVDPFPEEAGSDKLNEVQLSPVIDRPNEKIHTLVATAAPRLLTAEAAKQFLRDNINAAKVPLFEGRRREEPVAQQASIGSARHKGPSVLLHPAGTDVRNWVPAPSARTVDAVSANGTINGPEFDAHALVKQARQYRNENCLRQQLSEEMFLRLHPQAAGSSSSSHAVNEQVRIPETSRFVRAAPPVPLPAQAQASSNADNFSASKFFAGASTAYFDINRNAPTNVGAAEDFLKASPTRSRALRVFSNSEERELYSKGGEGQWHWSTNTRHYEQQPTYNLQFTSVR